MIYIDCGIDCSQINKRCPMLRIFIAFLALFYIANSGWANTQKKADEGSGWRPKNDFQELSLMLRDYEQDCIKIKTFDAKGEPSDLEYLKTKGCISEHNKLWQYIYKKFPMIRSGEI